MVIFLRRARVTRPVASQPVRTVDQAIMTEQFDESPPVSHLASLAKFAGTQFVVMPPGSCKSVLTAVLEASVSGHGVAADLLSHFLSRKRPWVHYTVDLILREMGWTLPPERNVMDIDEAFDRLSRECQEIKNFERACERGDVSPEVYEAVLRKYWKQDSVAAPRYVFANMLRDFPDGNRL